MTPIMLLLYDYCAIMREQKATYQSSVNGISELGATVYSSDNAPRVDCQTRQTTISEAALKLSIWRSRRPAESGDVHRQSSASNR